MTTSAAAAETPHLQAELEAVSLRRVLRRGLPTVTQESVLPLLVFYLGWRLGGLALGVALSFPASLAIYLLERRRGRQGLLARLSLLFVTIQAVVGLASGSAVVYLAQPVLVNAAWGVAHLATAVAGRPLAGMFAQAVYPVADEVRASRWYRAAFTRVSLVWAGYFLARSALRLVVLTSASVDAFLVVTLLTGFPVMLVLGAWSAWYAIRAYRRAEQPRP